MEVKGVSTETSMIEALKVCRESFIGVGIFSGFANLLMLVPAFFMLNVYDKAVGNNSIDTLFVLSLFTIVMFLGLGCLETVRSRILVRIASRLDLLLGEEIYTRMFSDAVSQGGNSATTQPLVDFQSLKQFLTGTAVFAIFDAPWLPIYLAILFLFHPLLGWMGVAAVLLFGAIALANQRSAGPALTKASEISRKNNADTLRNLRNAEVVASMGMGLELQNKWRERQDKFLLVQEAASETAALYNSVIKTLRLAIQSAAIAAGAYLVLKQEISPGMIIAGSILIGRALQPVELAVGSWKGFVDARQRYERLSEGFEKTPPKVESMRLPPITGEIKARVATIFPPGSKTQPVIQQATFDIGSGETVLILGASGAGKSSLIRAILGLWPTSLGEIRIDGAEAFNYDRDEIGPQIGYLPQDIELLDGTVSSNICRFSQVDADAVVQAASDAGIHEFILTLPKGYDTVIGQPGGLLSPGQRQRIGLARAMYRRPKLVVLDEPNSNLDEAGEVALNHAIASLKECGSTIIIVSHRAKVLPLADVVMILAEGRITDWGPAEDVITRLRAGHDRPGSKTGAIATALPAEPHKKTSDEQLTEKKTAAYRTVSWPPGPAES